MKVRISWKAKLILVIEAILIILMVVLLWYINSHLFQLLFRYNKENQLKTLRYISGELSGDYVTMQTLTSSIFTNTDVNDFYMEGYGMDRTSILVRQKVVSYLNQQLHNYPDIYSIFIQTDNGQIGVEADYTYFYLNPGNTSMEDAKKWSLNEIPQHSDRQKEKGFLITYSKTYQYQGEKVTIVLNFYEKAIRDNYTSVIQSGDADILLCDTTGRILSSSGSDIGTVFEPFERQVKGGSQGSFIVDDTTQVIYLAVPNMGWFIVEKMTIEQFNKDIDGVRKTLTYLLILSMLFINLFLYLSMKRLLHPMKTLTKAMRQIRDGKVGYQIDAVYHNEFDDIIQTFNAMSQSTAQLIEQNRLKEEQKQRYALSALRAQINPHFMFNTINTIKWMAIAQKAEHIKSALDMLQQLIRPLFRENTGEITLQEELDYVSNYINLINLRFGGNMEMCVDIPEESYQQKIPSFIIQPIIENCVEHGFHGNYSVAKIWISCEITGRDFYLIIQDNGGGIPEDKLAEIRRKLDATDTMLQNGEKLGLANVNLRIRLKYGNDYGITLEQGTGGGTRVLVKLPQIE